MLVNKSPSDLKRAALGNDLYHVKHLRRPENETVVLYKAEINSAMLKVN